uniref:Uncharacterized protein n=1 Tax=Oryza brachyantha TaxID=4533 RepID=J3MQ63_ORYBR
MQYGLLIFYWKIGRCVARLDTFDILRQSQDYVNANFWSVCPFGLVSILQDYS